MKIEMYEEKEKPEEVLRLKAYVDDDGDFNVVAVDEKGNELDCGNILIIEPDGTLMRCLCCKVPGIQTDFNGQIKLKES